MLEDFVFLCVNLLFRSMWVFILLLCYFLMVC